MMCLSSAALITALVHDDGPAAAQAMRRIAEHLLKEGAHLAGFLQYEQERPDRCRCDMILHELASDMRFGISQDRGAAAQGCRLDVGELLRAMQKAREAVEAGGVDCLFVNKFGKTEAEGGGMRPLIAQALDREIPVLVAVPRINLEAWRAFAGELAVEVRLEDAPDNASALCAHLGLVVPQHALAEVA